MLLDHVAPHRELADALLPFAVPNASDGAHDIAHVTRVWRNVQSIAAVEGGDTQILLAATLLHDCVSVEKDSPERAKASTLAAEKAREILGQQGWSDAAILRVAHAIEAHSFSANVTPTSLEARILQDADRLDAIGLIGVARCFYVAGRMGSALYEPADPRGTARALRVSALQRSAMRNCWISATPSARKSALNVRRYMRCDPRASAAHSTPPVTLSRCTRR